MKILAIAVLLLASCSSAGRGTDCRLTDKMDRQLTVVVRHAESHAPLPRASVIFMSSASVVTKEADERGRVQFLPEVSKITVVAHLNGFVPASSEIVVSTGYECSHVLELREDPEFARLAAH